MIDVLLEQAANTRLRLGRAPVGPADRSWRLRQGSSGRLASSRLCGAAATGAWCSLIPQRTFGRTSARPLRSISFSQRPDVVIEVSAKDRPTLLILFDPKYKLRSEELTPTED